WSLTGGSTPRPPPGCSLAGVLRSRSKTTRRRVVESKRTAVAAAVRSLPRKGKSLGVMIISSLAAGVKPGSVVADAIPGALRELPQWVGWRSEPRPGRSKPAKVPVDPNTGRAADPTAPRTWGQFDRAMSFANEHRLAGVGFVFAAGGPFAGVDVDRCR